MLQDLPSIHGLILAGGRSSRMGTDKALLAVVGKPLLMHIIMQMKSVGVKSVTVAVNDAAREEVYRNALTEHGGYESVQYVHDQFIDCGPIAGLHAGLSMMPEEGYVFVLACDMPMLSESLLDRMAAECALIETEEHVEVIRTPLQPFHALYHTSAVPKLLLQLERGEFRMMRMLDQLSHLLIQPTLAEEEAFRNLNTPEAYESFIGL
ncbi:molybdenum cofactor guanylyltransferase [Paenibacillus baekrokdamisoli]|uniref:Probable molybdenum cofactor guanylyltransferase n=1 Tax=Paenibacillus baekrokdamisoli TaxID=1712516 RepID=A0A3G9JCV1_9BACL|nr:molybdenum cofactor guanylyltransferase [Paenibacillus baekrokdamisoli]MBB3068970.1 molybdopterin-guanine dinucleotide biosynthesis protein A [Paenibacillus baekrokdamisoli]BBH23791.1 molybdenum cofactor guanylyltransferase [Paenibacillus baekrokdamisoli]